MDQKMIDRFRNQTVQICNNQETVGTGFFVNDETIVTAEHCVCKEVMKKNKKVSLYRDSKLLCEAVIMVRKNGVAFLYAIQYLSQEERFPLGYCKDLQYGDEIEIYGYPQKQPKGYPLEISVTENCPQDEDTNEPSIRCLVRNIERGLDRYDGLSGSPAVAWGHIVGMVAKEDVGGGEANSIYILDFSRVLDLFSEEEIDLTEVYRPRNEKSTLPKNKVKIQSQASLMSLYKQAWWMMKAPMGEEADIKISDRYSTVLATLLLGMQGEGNTILASPWEYGLADNLERETIRYKKEYPSWKGRQWLEFREGRMPDWKELRENSGVVLSIGAEEISDVWLTELLIGRRGAGKNLFVVWNIWSEQPERAVSQAMELMDRFEAKEGREALSVFPSWKKISHTSDEWSQALLVNEIAKEWVKSQEWSDMDLQRFLLNVEAEEETDLLVWQVYQRYMDTKLEEWNVIYKKLSCMCSESVKTFLTFCEKGDNLESLLDVQPSILKSWFSGVKKEECGRILAYLKEQNNQTTYWNAVISNPNCTGVIFQEWCIEERRELVELIFSQKKKVCKDSLLCEEADNIRRQLKPI